MQPLYANDRPPDDLIQELQNAGESCEERLQPSLGVSRVQFSGTADGALGTSGYLFVESCKSGRRCQEIDRPEGKSFEIQGVGVSQSA